MLSAATIILAALILATLAAVVGYVLGWANHVFHVEVDPKVEAIMEVLPGANCGGCGFVGCAEYAEAVVRGEADVTLCIPGGPACTHALAKIMGVAVSETFPYRAVVHCAAREDQRLQRMEYYGEQTCNAANLVAGVQGCVYGCLGLGDCVRACQYEAIHINDGLAVVDYEKCVGCGACVPACPRNVISMVPFKAERMLVVACCNRDFGLDVKKVCEVGCIGCKSCSRESSVLNMSVNLPVIDYDWYDPQADLRSASEKCPRGTLIFVGKAGPEGRGCQNRPDLVHHETPTPSEVGSGSHSLSASPL
jgi:RnfABCDGE-type electron transport complex B subunit